MDAFIQCEVENRAHDIACQKLLLGSGSGSPSPSPHPRVTTHISPSQSLKGKRRQPSPPPRYQQRQNVSSKEFTITSSIYYTWL